MPKPSPESRVQGSKQKDLRTSPWHRYGWRQHWRAFHTLLAVGFQADRGQWLSTLVANVLMQVGELAAVYALKLLTDGVLRQSVSGALTAAAVIAVAWALVLVSGRTYVRMVIQIEEKAGNVIDRRLMGLTASIAGIDHFERPEYADELALLRSQRHLLGGMTNALVLNVRVWTSLIGASVLLARLHPVLVLLPLFGLGSLAAGRRANAIQHTVEEANAERTRLKRHIFTLATSAGPGKEVRVFALADELVARHRRVADQIMQDTAHAARKRATLEIAGSLCFAVGYIGSIAFVLMRAVRGQATPGDVVLGIGLAAQMNATVAGVVDMGNMLGKAHKAAGRYLWLADYAARARLVPANAAPVPAQLASGIALEHVTFRYPGTDRTVLDDLSVRLPAGAVVALVGENGAGKTTLVKLLSRFYEPDAGRITVDGVDLRRLDVEAWRERISAGYQDFARFELRARETVGVGDLPRLDQTAVIEGALERARARDVVATLPKGLETQLGKAWEGGVELSGGQWQKLALARALMRATPLLRVFDEPTAALDAQTEHALFESSAQAARGGGSQGSVTLLVSHRFSTVRMADLIVVLDKGRVLEQGSHQDLMANRGLYAELYELQSRAYR